MAGFTLPTVDHSNALANLGQVAGQFRQRREQNQLGALLPQAYAGDQNALAQIAQISAPAYTQIQNQNFERGRIEKADALTAAKTEREAKLEGLKWSAGTLIGAATPELREQIYTGQVKPKLESLGFTGLPDRYDATVEATANSILERFPDVPKAPTPTSDMQNYEMAVKQGFGGTLQDWIIGQKKAGAAKTEVSVNTGQKGFENELKIRGDFRSEPVYKAFQEVETAFKQIQSGLDAESPAGDLAAATKYMKILDPTSVVRESELGMAMAATGALDRLSNYANRIVTGEKLSPSQRADFRKLSGEFYDKSVEQYNAKRGEYYKIAGEYGMNADRVTGPAPAKQKTAPVQIMNDADYAALTAGSTYIAPDGSTRVKK